MGLDRKPSRTLPDTFDVLAGTHAPLQPLARDFSTERPGCRDGTRFSGNGDNTGWVEEFQNQVSC